MPSLLLLLVRSLMGLIAPIISRLALGHADPVGTIKSLSPSPPISDPSAARAIALAIATRSYMGLSVARPVAGAVTGVTRVVVLDGGIDADAVETGGTDKAAWEAGGSGTGDRGSGLWRFIAEREKAISPGPR